MKAFKKYKPVAVALLLLLAVAFILSGCALFTACSQNGDNDVEKDIGSGGVVDESKWNVLGGLAVGFFSEADCPYGDIDDSKSKRELNSKPSERQYIVADFTIRPPADNDGKGTVTAEVKISSAGSAFATLQETNTGNVSEEKTDGVTSVKAVYRVPDRAEVARKIRLVVRIDAKGAGLADISLKLDSPADMPELSANIFKKQGVMGYTENLIYDGSAVTGITDGGEVVIPTEHDGVKIDSIKEGAKFANAVRVVIHGGIKKIPPKAFENGGTLKEVTLPDGLTSIGYNAFYNCENLNKINLPDSVTFIGGYAFHNCGKLTQIKLPESLAELGSEAFYRCVELTEINIPKGVTKFGNSAFSGCTGLTSATVADGVSKIGDSAFYGCKKLALISLPESLGTIGRSAFSGCESLKSVTVPKGVTWLYESTFEDCAYLTEITIDKSMLRFDEKTFYGCSKLTDVNFGGSKEDWKAIIKKSYWCGGAGNFTVHCSDGDLTRGEAVGQ